VFRSIVPALKVAAIAAFAVSLSSVQVAAQSAPTRASSVVYLPGKAVFDWRAKRSATQQNSLTNAELVRSDDAPKIRQSRFFGHGSYICSPSGFGRKSTCFAR